MRPCSSPTPSCSSDRVLDAVAASPTPVRWLVVAAEPVTSVDVTSADMLAELDETLHAAGIELCFAEMKDPVKDKLKRFGLFARLGEETFFPTMGAAVSSYLETHPVEWDGLGGPQAVRYRGDGHGSRMPHFLISAFFNACRCRHTLALRSSLNWDQDRSTGKKGRILQAGCMAW